MQAIKNANGLYEFEIEILGERKSKKLKGLIDTGSTECAATYKVITTLQIRPIAHEKISTVNNIAGSRFLVYSAPISFSGKSHTVSLYRINDLPQGIDFIIGMSILSKCKIDISGDTANISWL